jgi:hypothetical protein
MVINRERDRRIGIQARSDGASISTLTYYRQTFYTITLLNQPFLKREVSRAEYLILSAAIRKQMTQ